MRKTTLYSMLLTGFVLFALLLSTVFVVIMIIVAPNKNISNDENIEIYITY